MSIFTAVLIKHLSTEITLFISTPGIGFKHILSSCGDISTCLNRNVYGMAHYQPEIEGVMWEVWAFS
jgi:hypothetical protein